MSTFVVDRLPASASAAAAAHATCPSLLMTVKMRTAFVAAAASVTAVVDYVKGAAGWDWERGTVGQGSAS